jgi:hypothetical protein
MIASATKQGMRVEMRNLQRKTRFHRPLLCARLMGEKTRCNCSAKSRVGYSLVSNVA